ncbi:extracellular solute-binding protein [Spongiactinospora sp. TRM90649]|uniref:ABC transporter substrate-binding protein n=1 Tax=Spongiactinospora sp. TRM90649 TaxID=3031114 RepID=UPI0023F7CE89|nr:extracellular solute-binding protein [Spongiactinospora sp. TRM90649]MDF5752485.1 extracellular solute-binding protein [Spongiactinospora sp. TRM90649]
MPKRTAAVLASLVLTGALVNCGGGEHRGGGITVWTEENLPDRMAAQRAILADFTRKTGVRVNLVGIAEDQFSQIVTSAAAAGDLPDVIGALPLASVRELEAAGLLDRETPDAVVTALGRDTFSARALELVTSGGRLLAVPSDAWAQLILYRSDLYKQAGLAPPDTYERLQAAASRLDRGELAGITLAVAPRDTFTAQSFEHVALANGCELIDGAGRVALDSPACVRAFRFYADLARKYSVPGKQDVDSTRATYFAGRAACTIWSSFILDELAGLRRDALPSCPRCRSDPMFLAANTGVVTALKGPDARRPAQYGEIVSWAVTREADTKAARAFVSYMMSDGYVRWFGMAPEGKVPVRKGFEEAWKRAPTGVDAKRPLADLYPESVLDALMASPDTFSRWGIPQGQGRLVGAMMGELPVPRALSALVAGTLTPEQAAAQAQRDVETVKRGLRE